MKLLSIPADRFADKILKSPPIPGGVARFDDVRLGLDQRRLVGLEIRRGLEGGG